MRGVAADNRRDECGQPRSERDYGEPQWLPHVINGVIAVQRGHGQATCPETRRDLSSHAIDRPEAVTSRAQAAIVGVSLRLRTFRREDISIHEGTATLPSLSYVVLEQPRLWFAAHGPVTTRPDVQQLGAGVETHVGRIDVVPGVSGDLFHSIRLKADVDSSTWHRRAGNVQEPAISKRQIVIPCASWRRDAWSEPNGDARCSGVLLDDRACRRRPGTARHSNREDKRHWSAIPTLEQAINHEQPDESKQQAASGYYNRSGPDSGAAGRSKASQYVTRPAKTPNNGGKAYATYTTAQ